jgi:molybdopterin-containing oxidoreductase family iron-sulfur binding subunit
MNIPRKGFLKLAALPFAALVGEKWARIAGRAEASTSNRADRGVGRWAMAIDTRKCMKDEGCSLCVKACHQAHNVPEVPDSRHAVKWIWKEKFQRVFRAESVPLNLGNAPVMVLCNHCDSPACTRVCPTGATWKRQDGIVMMDYHRCIGCRYCMAACPYGSRSFNWSDPRPYLHSINPDFPTRTKGVVEKCNFCEERLASGKAPRCVEACPERALIFGDLKNPNSELQEILRSRYAIRRQPELGTGPGVFYIV